MPVDVKKYRKIVQRPGPDLLPKNPTTAIGPSARQPNSLNPLALFRQLAHTHPFNGPFSGTTRVIRHQKGKTNLDFTEARDSEWQWRQLGHMQVCTSLQTDNHASTQPLWFSTGRMTFLLPKQQCQSTEGRQLTHWTRKQTGNCKNVP